jgi:transposase
MFYRQEQVDAYLAGHPVLSRIVRSIQRWIRDGIGPLRQTGNKGSYELSGEHLLLLVLFKLIWPHAINIECSVFIANNSTDGKLFTKQEISHALLDLGYTRKVTSTLAYQAFTEQNLMRREIFWTQQFPVGIHGTPRRQLIDVDEFGIHKNSANCKQGSSLKGLYIKKPGHYDRGDFKLTIIIAVEPGDPALDGQNPPALGSTENPHIWAEVSEEAGTTAEAYTQFLVQKPLASYNAAVEQKTIIHDNLTAHKAPMVYEAVRRSGHRVVPRPPYRPQDGPVEYAINQVLIGLASHWSELKEDATPGDMRVLMLDIIDKGVKGMNE